MRQLQQKYSPKLLRSTKVVGVVLGIGGMVFLGAVCTKTATNTNDINAETNSSISNANENANSSEIDTSDWLTYTNEEYGFSFRYPGGWILDEDIPTGGEIKNTTAIVSISTSAWGPTFNVTSTTLSSDEKIKEIKEFDAEISPVLSVESFRIDNAIKATKIIKKSAMGFDSLTYVISISDKNTIVLDSISGKTQEAVMKTFTMVD